MEERDGRDRMGKAYGGEEQARTTVISSQEHQTLAERVALGIIQTLMVGMQKAIWIHLSYPHLSSFGSPLCNPFHLSSHLLDSMDRQPFSKLSSNSFEHHLFLDPNQVRLILGWARLPSICKGTSKFSCFPHPFPHLTSVSLETRRWS